MQNKYVLGIVAVGVAGAVVGGWVYTHRPQQPDEPFDVGNCIHRALVQQTTTSETDALDIAAKVKEATNASVGIKDENMRTVLQHAMSDANQAKAIDGCVAQYVKQDATALTLYMPMVQAVEQGKSKNPIPHAHIANGATYEQCDTGEEGKCNILIARRTEGSDYALVGTCAGACSGYLRGTKVFTAAELKSNLPLELPMALDRSTLTFRITRGGVSLAGVDVAPDTSQIHFRTAACFAAQRSDADCRHAETTSTGATFHFDERPTGTLDVTLTVDRRTLRKKVTIPDDALAIDIPIDQVASSSGAHPQDAVPR